MTAPRDDEGDRIRTAEVCGPEDLTDSDRKSNRPSRTVAPRVAGGAPPKWADECPETWRRG